MMRTKRKLIVCILSFALALGMIPATSVSAAKKVGLSNKNLTITKGKSKTIKVKNTKKKVTWKILSGKKYITLKKKGKTAATIRGKKKGTAKVQAKVGKKKMICTVKVKNAKQPKKTTPSNSTANKKPTATPTPPASIKPTATPTPPASTKPTVTPTPDTELKKKVVSVSYSGGQKYAFLEKGKRLVDTGNTSADYQNGEVGIGDVIYSLDVKYEDGTVGRWGAGIASYDFSQINYEKTGISDIILTYEGYTCKLPVVIAERKTEGLYTYLTDGNIAELEGMIGDKKIDDEDSDYDYEFTSTTLKIPETLGGAKVVQGLPDCDFEQNKIKKVEFPQYYQEDYSRVAWYFGNAGGYYGHGFVQLEEFAVDQENDYYTVRDHVLFAENETVLCVYPAGLTATTYQIPEGVIKFELNPNGNFSNNPYLEEITFPESWGGVDSDAGEADVMQWGSYGNFLSELPNLKKINVADGNPYFCSIDDVLYIKEGENELSLLTYPAQKMDQSFTVEENVSSIVHYGLYSKHLENITFKSPETDIGNGMSADYIKNIYLDFYLSDRYDADMYLNDYYFRTEDDLDDSAHFNFNIYIRNEKSLACIAESLQSKVNVIYY